MAKRHLPWINKPHKLKQTSFSPPPSRKGGLDTRTHTRTHTVTPTPAIHEALSWAHKSFRKFLVWITRKIMWDCKWALWLFMRKPCDAFIAFTAINVHINLIICCFPACPISTEEKISQSVFTWSACSPIGTTKGIGEMLSSDKGSEPRNF